MTVPPTARKEPELILDVVLPYIYETWHQTATEPMVFTAACAEHASLPPACLRRFTA